MHVQCSIRLPFPSRDLFGDLAALGYTIVILVPWRGFRGRFWAVFGRKPKSMDQNRSHIVRAEGPGSFGLFWRPLALGLQPKPPMSREQ